MLDCAGDGPATCKGFGKLGLEFVEMHLQKWIFGSLPTSANSVHSMAYKVVLSVCLSCTIFPATSENFHR